MFLTTLLLGMDRWCLRLWNCSVPNAHKHWVSFVTGNLPGNFVMNWEIIRLSFKCQKPRAIWINSPEGISSQNGHHSHGFSRVVSRTAGSHQKSPWICTSSLQTGPESWAPGLACVMPLSIYSGRKKRTQASLTVCPSCFAGLLPHKHFPSTANLLRNVHESVKLAHRSIVPCSLFRTLHHGNVPNIVAASPQFSCYHRCPPHLGHWAYMFFHTYTLLRTSRSSKWFPVCCFIFSFGSPASGSTLCNPLNANHHNFILSSSTKPVDEVSNLLLENPSGHHQGNLHQASIFPSRRLCSIPPCKPSNHIFCVLSHDLLTLTHNLRSGGRYES